MYGISSAWTMDEWLPAATPFGSTRHTGEAIDRITGEALKRQGVKWREGGSVYEAVHGKVSDNASNMAKGKDGLPALAKMARQYLGRPASSAGVERMFSKAGKLYGDEKKGQEDETLEHSLFAAANTEI